jgi:hypothetical protein
MQIYIARRCSPGAELCRLALSCVEGHRTVRLEDAEDLVAGNNLDLGDTVRVTEDLTDPIIPSVCSLPKTSHCMVSAYWEGVAPFLASLQIWSTTCSGVVFNHAGGLRE